MTLLETVWFHLSSVQAPRLGLRSFSYGCFQRTRLRQVRPLGGRADLILPRSKGDTLMLAVQAHFLAAEAVLACHDPARILNISERLSDLAEQLSALEQMMVPPHLRTLPQCLPANVTQFKAAVRSR